MPIDAELAAALLARFPLLTEDADAHRAEHAIEVQLPFLQAKRPQFRFVPIAIGTRQYDALAGLGKSIGEVVAGRNERCPGACLERHEPLRVRPVTRVKDHKAIERILALDPRGLLRRRDERRHQHVWLRPRVAMLTATQSLGATQAELVKYATSGDVSGDRQHGGGICGRRG